MNDLCIFLMLNEFGFFRNAGVIPFYFGQPKARHVIIILFFIVANLTSRSCLQSSETCPTGTKDYTVELNKHLKIIALIVCGIK